MGWADILGVGASAASGGLFGLAGSLLGSVFKYFNARQEHEFEKARWEHEDKLIKLQMEAKVLESEHELAVVAQSGSWSALKESMAKLTAAGESYRWVNAVKDLFRPFITLFLLIVAYMIFYDIMQMFKGGESALSEVFDKNQASELVTYIVYSLVFAATTALTWWFADRGFAPPGLKNR